VVGHIRKKSGVTPRVLVADIVLESIKEGKLGPFRAFEVELGSKINPNNAALGT